MQTVSNNGQRAANNCAQLPHSADAQIVANADDKISFSHFENKRDNAPKSVLMDWRQLCDRLKNRSFRASKDGPLFSGAVYPEQVWRREHQVPDPQDPTKKLSFRDPRNPTPEDWRAPIRSNDFVEAVSLAILDFDGGATLDQIKSDIQRLNNGAGAAAVIYSTFSHAPDAPKFRVFIWLLVPVAASEWPEFWARLSRHFGDKCDASAKDAARIHYTPSCPKSGEADAVYIELDGAPLDGATLPAIPKTATAAPKIPTTATAIGGDAYARQTLQNECDRLRATTSHRNETLNKKAINIGGYISAGRIDRADAENALEAAMHANGYIEKDGLAAMRATMKSGLDAGMRTPNYQNLPTERTRSKNSAPQISPDPHINNGEAKASELFPLDEIGNGKRFAATYGHALRFCGVRGQWQTYQGGQWKPDDEGVAEQCAKKMAQQVAIDAGSAKDDDQRARQLKHALSLTKRATRDTMLKDAASEAGMMVTPEAFDNTIELLNLVNGTLDLATGEFRAHDARDLLTRQASVAFDANADCPMWRACVQQWMPHKGVAEYAQECAGLSLTGRVYEEFFNLLIGPGNNGKTTFLRKLERVAGSYYTKTEAETIMLSRDGKRAEAPAPALLALKGARLVTVHELDSKHKLNGALIKDLTGRDSITARGLFEKRPTTFLPQFTLWAFGNSKPQIADDSKGMWRRVRIIDFDQVIPADQRDPHLGEKLEAELSGILNWALEGLKRVQQRGLSLPDAVNAATEAYRAEQNPLAGFLSDCCTTHPHATEGATELYSHWCQWCRENGEREGTARTFGIALKAKGFENYRGASGRRWRGLTASATVATVAKDAEPAKVSGEKILRGDFPRNSVLCDGSDGGKSLFDQKEAENSEKQPENGEIGVDEF